jgi:hypothetical protein
MKQEVEIHDAGHCCRIRICPVEPFIIFNLDMWCRKSDWFHMLFPPYKRLAKA